MKLSSNQKLIIEILIKEPNLRSSQIHTLFLDRGVEISLITVKRELSELLKNKYISLDGIGRSTTYSIDTFGRIFFELESSTYSRIDPDNRYGFASFNFELLNRFPVGVLSKEDVIELETYTHKFTTKSQFLSDILVKKELERLVIELSWKSSKIEGNTYTLLDTEKLLKENQVAIGYTQEETQMVLNHKTAFDFIYNNRSNFKNLTKKSILEIHKLLTEKLGVKNGYRSGSVGITGSKYKPLDNVHQIEEVMDKSISIINDCKTPFDKALVALSLISYIQPFEDGNKRTSRLLTNALLLAHNCAPLSYRGIDEEEYRSAMLTFYEINSIIPLRKIFIEQYKSASENYSIKI